MEGNAALDAQSRKKKKDNRIAGHGAKGSSQQSKGTEREIP